MLGGRNEMNEAGVVVVRSEIMPGMPNDRHVGVSLLDVTSVEMRSISAAAQNHESPVRFM